MISDASKRRHGRKSRPGSTLVTSSEASPRALRSSEMVRLRRQQLLHAPHMGPLVQYVERLRADSDWEVPDFDPVDGGTNAKILFLAEKPGPMTSLERPGTRAGSGFISLDNDDPTAEAGFRFLAEAGIPRSCIVKWNVVPGWNGTRRITALELRRGVDGVTRLLEHLPALRAIVLVGKNAQRAEPLMGSSRVRIFCSPHPSALVRARYPDRWNDIPRIWREAGQAAGCLEAGD
jgi:hypothetical protein